MCQVSCAHHEPEHTTYSVAGWTVFDRLYILKGVPYIVTDEPDSIPDISFIYSKALFIENGAEAEASRLPSKEDIHIVSTKEAKRIFGLSAQKLDGVSVSSTLIGCQAIH